MEIKSNELGDTEESEHSFSSDFSYYEDYDFEFDDRTK